MTSAPRSPPWGTRRSPAQASPVSLQCVPLHRPGCRWVFVPGEDLRQQSPGTLARVCVSRKRLASRDPTPRHPGSAPSPSVRSHCALVGGLFFVPLQFSGTGGPRIWRCGILVAWLVEIVSPGEEACTVY